MAIKEIKTRVALRTGDYAYWTTGAGKDIELYKGEVCICTVAKADNQAQTAPTVLFKVADATGKKFADLDWCSAKAADVYDWAKKSQEEFITWVNTVVEHPVITTGKTNGTIAVDGVDVPVKGLQDAAYVTVESLNATAKGYADAVEAKLPTSANYGVLEVKAGTGIEVTGDDAQRPVIGVKANTYDAYGAAADVAENVADGTIVAKEATHAGTATHANAAGEVDHELTIKVGGTNVVFNGSAAKEADIDAAIAAGVKEAKDYADAKPHKNTAHSHSVGAGLAVTGEGGISGDVKYALNVAFELVDKTIKLYDKADESKTAIATLDATEFIADGMLSSVTADQTNNKLVFEWNTDAGVTKTEIPLDAIADIYTGSTGSEVNVAVSNENVISASLNSEVATKIANGSTAYSWGDHASAGYAKAADLGDLAVKDKIVEGDIDGTIGVSKITDFADEVKAIKVDNAGHADTANSADEASHAETADLATSADNAGKLGGELPSYYATAQSVTDITKDNGTIDSKIAAYNTSKNFGDIITHNAAEFATAEQGDKADSALQGIAAGTGLKVSAKADNSQTIDIDDEVIFVLNCNF